VEHLFEWLAKQGPSVVILATVLWFIRKDYIKEMQRLQDRIQAKDEQLLEYIHGMNAVSRAIDKLTERLK
jgi:hypothetical protein